MVVLPILIVAPSARAACSTRLPLTSMPLVEPRSSTVIRGAPPRSWASSTRISMCLRETPGSSMRRSASLPAADHDAGWGERELLAVDLEGRGGSAYLGVGRVAAGQAGLRDRPALDPEAPGGEVVARLQMDADRSGEDVGLLGRVLAQHLGELARQLRPETLEALVVGLGELDGEGVGHQASVTAEDLGGVVDLAVERRGDLDRLHRAAEGAREDTGDHLLQLVLEALQSTHVASPQVVVAGRAAFRPAGSPTGPVGRWGDGIGRLPGAWCRFGCPTRRGIT